VRAAVFHGAGDVRIADVPDVRQPGSGEIVLDVVRAAICGTDAAEYAHGPKMVPLHHRHAASGHEGPVVLGHEFVGYVRAVGDGDAVVAVGDRVVPGAGAWCGACRWCREGRTNLCERRYLVGIHCDGGLADAAVVPAAMCHAVPAACSDDAAAIAQPLAIALHALDRATDPADASLVVIGAGGIGAFVIAAAKERGFATVVAIDVSPRRLAVATDLGADHVVAADAPHLDERLRELTGGDGPDVVVEASGAPSAPAQAASLVRAGGRIGIVGMQSAPSELDLFSLAQWEVDLVPANAHVCATDLPRALELLASTDLAERVLGARIPLQRLVPDGLVPLVEATATGKIVVEVVA
jgi:(R,R)-butanediol dehydrogenase / meso-butanediol dehydrogenase / diacetyl reductase